MARGRLAGLAVVVLALATGLSLLASLSCAVETKGFTVTSSVDSNHSHMVTIVGADVDKPPAEKTYDTSEAGGTPHKHTIKLTKAEFDDLKNGKEAKVTASSVNNHVHAFVLKKS